MPSPRYVSLADAAVYLGVTESALRTMVQRRQVPHHRPTARTVRFDLRALDRWMAAHEVEAAS